MALTDSFPGPNAVTDSIEAGKDIAGLITPNADGSPRAGILSKGPGNLVTGRTDLRVDIAPFKAALVRDGAVRLIANDSGAQSPTFTLPTANSRIDVLYVKVGEPDLVAAEPAATFFGILEGAAAPVPIRPTLNIDGALELATVRVSAGITNTAAVPITQTAPVSGGARPSPASVELSAKPLIGKPGLNVIGSKPEYPWSVVSAKTQGRDDVISTVNGSSVTVLPGPKLITASITLSNGGSPQAVNGRSFIEVVADQSPLQPRLRANPAVGEDSWTVSGAVNFAVPTVITVNVLAAFGPTLAGSQISLTIARIG